MFESFSSRALPVRTLLVLGALSCAFAAHGQASPAATAPVPEALDKAKDYAVTAKKYLTPRHEVALAITYENASANLTFASPVTFQTQGGGVEASAMITHGFGGVASIHGFHTTNSGQGVPVNLIVEAFGPRYTYRTHKPKHPVSLFGQGLVGEANGFLGLYPDPSGPTTSATSLAFEVGGGLDIGFTPHVAVRLFQADWVRTELPNATTNIQNTLRLGIGIVIHTTRQ